MLGLFRNLLIATLAFAIGLAAANAFVTPTTLEEISRNISSYEGKRVVVETYAQFENVLGWTIGEPFEKYERTTFIEFDSDRLNHLRQDLAHDLPAQSYYRVRVRATGTVEDNCNDGIITCCFGESMTLKDGSLSVIGDVESYTRPEPK